MQLSVRSKHENRKQYSLKGKTFEDVSAIIDDVKSIDEMKLILKALFKATLFTNR